MMESASYDIEKVGFAMNDQQPTPSNCDAKDIRGHVMGIVDPAVRTVLMEDLSAIGMADDRILLLQGEEGLAQLRCMMDGSQWGESAEKFLDSATAELHAGMGVIAVQVTNVDEAVVVSSTAARHSVRNVYHFGHLVDTRLTA